MFVRVILAVTVLSVALGLPAHAQDAYSPPEPVDESEAATHLNIELSFTDMSGNQTVQVFTTRFEVTAIRPVHTTKLRFDSRFGRNDENTIAERYAGALEWGLHAGGSWVPMIRLALERDRFRKIAWRSEAGAGVRRLFNPRGERFRAAVDVSVLDARENYTEDIAAVHNARVRLAADGEMKLNGAVTVSHHSNITPRLGGMGDYHLLSRTTGLVRLTDSLNLTTTFEFNRTSQPQPGVKPNDRLMMVGIRVEL